MPLLPMALLTANVVLQIVELLLLFTYCVQLRQSTVKLQTKQKYDILYY